MSACGVVSASASVYVYGVLYSVCVCMKGQGVAGPQDRTGSEPCLWVGIVRSTQGYTKYRGYKVLVRSIVD